MKENKIKKIKTKKIDYEREEHKQTNKKKKSELEISLLLATVDKSSEVAVSSPNKSQDLNSDIYREVGFSTFARLA